MATRESQGLQAALIVFVLITIALAVTTYVYFRKAEENANQADAATKRAAEAETAMRQAIDERNKLKEYLGFDIAEQMTAIEEQYNKDMTLYGADFPETDPKNYRTVVTYLSKAAVDKHTAAAEAERREQEALAAKKAAEDRAAQEVAAAEQKFTTAVSTYETEREKFKTDLQETRAQSQQVAAQLGQKDQAIAQAQAQTKTVQDQLTAQIQDMQKVLEGLLVQKREREQTNFETADGRITFVNPAERTAWIDLGIADGLQRHTTFSVYDQDVHTYSPETVKGQVEVINLLGRHQAEVRILDETTTNPIIAGDLIYTPAWRPGVFLHFAIAGFIDIDGDGIEDRELLRNIIQANGGVIDAETDAQGNVVGQMSVNTRYLIMGERPDERTGEAPRVAFTNMYEQATRYGVELMPLPRFLSLVGYKGGAQTVDLGGSGAPVEGGAQPRAGAAQPRAGAAQPRAGANPQPRAGAGDAFRPRRPPARGEAGAF